MSKSNESVLTRRQALQGVATLVGGSIAVTQLGAFMSRAAVAASEGAGPVFLDDDQFTLVLRSGSLPKIVVTVSLDRTGSSWPVGSNTNIGRRFMAQSTHTPAVARKQQKTTASVNPQPPAWCWRRELR